MRVKKQSPIRIVLKLLNRSQCKVQVAAVLTDSKGTHAWGWNHQGQSGMGEHAEIHCLKRANPDRVRKSIMWVAAQRRKSGNPVSAQPCAACAPAVRECGCVWYRNKQGKWVCWK